MIFKECNRILSRLDKLKLKGIENYSVKGLTFRLIYMYKCGYLKAQPVLKHIGMMFLRCMTDRNHIEGNGNILCYCSRPMTAIRSDHLTNFFRVTDLLDSKVLMYGTKLEKITFKRIKTLALPFIWNYQLKKCISDRGLRWWIVRDIYSGYHDLLEFQAYESKKKLDAKGILLLEETIASSQFLETYFRRRNLLCTGMMHGMSAADRQSGYYMANWHSDYLLAYSRYGAEMIKEAGGYKGNLVIAGMYQFIGLNLTQREINSIHAIGVFLDGSIGDEVRRMNLRMINLVIEACEGARIKIYVKLHPSNSMDDYRYYKENVKDYKNIRFFLKKPSSIEIERRIDMFVCRDTTCLFEAIYQEIPSFVYCDPPGLFSNIDEDIYFASAADLKRHMGKYLDGSQRSITKKIKLYLCGNEDPASAYEDFFFSIGWKKLSLQ